MAKVISWRPPPGNHVTPTGPPNSNTDNWDKCVAFFILFLLSHISCHKAFTKSFCCAATEIMESNGRKVTVHLRNFFQFISQVTSATNINVAMLMNAPLELTTVPMLPSVPTTRAHTSACADHITSEMAKNASSWVVWKTSLQAALRVQ